jgi:hypothetical protein
MHILTVIQDDAMEFHPSVGFQAAIFGTYPDPQVAGNSLTTKKPPKGQRTGEAIGMANPISGSRFHQQGSFTGTLEKLARVLDPIWLRSAEVG